MCVCVTCADCGIESSFTVYHTSRLSKMISVFCDKNELDGSKFRPLFDGTRVNETIDTVGSLGMENNDM